VTITSQPASLTTKENATFNFSVAYNAYSPLLGSLATVQWQTAPSGSSTFTDIPGATGANYGGTFAKASDNGRQYRAVVTSGDVSATSNPATLTVSGTVPLVTLPTTIEHRYWNNIAVNSVSALTSDPRYPNSPTFITFEPLFEYPPAGGNGVADTYGNRLAGWINPPEDGDYVFFTCSDDPSELWLSTDQDPVNKKLIAKELVWSNSREWTSSGGASDLTAKRSDQFTGTQWPVLDTVNGGAKITLQKGQHYYIEVLHTEGTGGDDVGVAWRKPSDAGDPANGDPPIPADNVDQIYAITGTINFTTNPVTQSAAQNSTATFTAAATSSDNSPITYIWQMAPKGSSTFTAVGSGASFTTPLLTAGDDGNQYRVLATSPTGAGLSSVATLTVTVDNVPPTVTYFNAYRTTAVIVFSEPVDATTGGNAANYTLSPSGTVTAATVGTTPAGLGMVTLDLSGLVDLQNYTLTIKNVKDTANNPIVQVAETFTAYDISADFNGPVAPPKSTITGSAKLLPALGPDGSAALQLTAAVGNLGGTIGFDDVLGGDTTNVTVKLKLFIGKGSGNAADGVSINIGGDVDPALGVGEEGAGSGLSVDFDTYDNGNGPNGVEAPAVEVKWAGALVTMPDGTPAQLIVPKATLVNNQWVDVFVQLKGDPIAGTGTVTVVHNNIKYFDNLPIDGFAAIANPKISIGGRTGGEFEEADMDNLIVVYNADVAPPSPPTISITAPANGASLPGGSAQTITVNAVAAAGVKQVEFFANGSSLGKSTTAPYSFTIPQTPPGYYVLTATITDNNNVAVTSAPITATVQQPASANAKKILFVVATAGPNNSNIAEANHLFGLGYDVTVQGAAPTVTADANGKAAVVVSSTVASGDVGNKFLTSTTPVMFWENNIEDDLLLTLNDTTVDHNATGGQTSIDILPGAAGHKLAAGLSGNVTITTAADAFSWGKPTSSAKQIATITGNAAQTVIYTVEAGDTLIDGTSKAAGRRVFFLMGDSTFQILNADGLKLFDAAVDYTVNGGGTGPQAAHLSVSSAGGNITITWTNGGTIYSAPAVTGPWTTTGNSTGTYTTATGGTMQFYKVQNP